jgi:hypothetical protein
MRYQEWFLDSSKKKRLSFNILSIYFKLVLSDQNSVESEGAPVR